MPTPKGTLLTLRGVNLNPDADPGANTAVKVWIEDGRRPMIQLPQGLVNFVAGPSNLANIGRVGSRHDWKWEGCQHAI